MNNLVKFPGSKIKAEINLPTSKSISNRLLIIQALAANSFQIKNLSDSDDTEVMLKAFASGNEVVDIHHAGTSMRFLTAYYAATSQKKTITGSERMKNRPIKELVNGLNQLGANIRYAEKEGYPPVVTSGQPLSGNVLSINGNISSQYITALLLVAPTLPQGLTIKIEGELISSSYLKMTLRLMKQYNISVTWENNTIYIPNQKYQGTDCIVEGDWSGASYWYEISALSDNAEIKIHGLTQNSLQGDSALVGMFEKIGVKTEFGDNFITLSKFPIKEKFFEYDFINNPDMVQTLVVTLCLLNIPFRISGADTLRIKETDRIAALQAEMKKLGFSITEPEKGVLAWDGKFNEPIESISIDTYNDHRMALSFAPAAIKTGKIVINNAEVVSKSYPSFWSDLKKAGFDIN